MIHRARIALVFALIAVPSVALPGCIAWRGDADATRELPPFRGVIDDRAGSLTVVHALWNARYDGERIVDRTPTVFAGDRYLLALRYAGTMLKRSGYFKSIKPSDVGGDLHLEMDYTVAPADPSWWFYVSRFVLHLLPASTSTRIELAATIERDGQEVKRYRYAETLTELRWIPAVFAMPFMTPARAQHAINDRMYRTLIHDLAKDRIIPYRR